MSVKLWDIARLLGVYLDQDSLSNFFDNFKLEIKKLEADTLTYDAPHDRLDLYSAEGLARAISYYAGFRKPTKYSISRSDVFVDSSRAPDYRPYVLMTIVRGVRLDDEAISQLFQLQEKLHLTHCGNRELVSIGLYDLDVLRFPVYYREVDTVTFRPLGYERDMSVREILAETEKGREYGHLVREGRYPLLVDSSGVVLSLPPIINSEDTKITERTKNVLIDVTGTEPHLMASILAVMTLATYERGASGIEVVPVVQGATTEKLISELLMGRRLIVRAERVVNLIGVDVSFQEALKHLGRYGYIVESASEDSATVWVPPYRVDVIDEDDIIEDIAISMDYNKIVGKMEPPTNRGIEHPLETISKYLRDILVGLGFTEVLNFMLTDPDYLMALGFTKFIDVKNPKMRMYSALRPSLLPGILKSLSRNVKKYGFQNLRIFEIGDVVDPRTLDSLRAVSGAIYGLGTTLTDGLAVTKTILEVFCLRPQFVRFEESELTIDERTAAVVVNGVLVGIVGEVHPKHLKYLELKAPVAVFEISVNKLAEVLGVRVF
ncbi:MAG: phenylalanine--tRNA ligase subunit beta [Sulfolobales archaeon]